MFTLNQIFIVPDDKFFLLNICDDVYLRLPRSTIYGVTRRVINHRTTHAHRSGTTMNSVDVTSQRFVPKLSKCSIDQSAGL